MRLSQTADSVDSACPLRRAAEGSGGAYWEWCVESNEVWYSDTWLEACGYERGQITASFEDFLSLVHPGDVDAVKEQLTAAASDGSRFDAELRIRTADRGDRWFRVAASPNVHEVGRIAYVSGVWHDVTDEHAAADHLHDTERQLHQKERMEALDCLAGGIAHEFNNVLQAVRGYVAFAMDELAEESQARSDLHQALLATDRAASLTRSLLDFARAEEQASERYDIRDILAGLHDLLRPVIGEHIDFNTNAAKTPMVCYADSQGLRQSLLNLCINARDAMPDGGELLVSAAPFAVDNVTKGVVPGLAEGWYSRIQVTDCGGGISPEVRDRVFDPFFSTKEVGRGTGLGLATVYGFVKRSGGRVDVYSEPGRGATFCIYLPIEEAEGMNYDPISPELRAGMRQTVLLVEDDSQVREVGRRSLEGAGYEVLTAADGEEGLESYIDNVDRIDMVVLDVVLPRLGGRRVFEEIRRLQSDVPVLFATGFDPVSTLGESSGQLADGAIAKPYDRQQLLSKVKSLIKAREEVSVASC